MNTFMSQEPPPKTERRVVKTQPIQLGPSFACLQVLQGAAAGLVVRIDAQEFMIGRSPESNLHFDDSAITWRHAYIRCRSNQYFLRDLDSTNGTFLDGQACQGEAPLRPGMLISLAESVLLRFSLLSESEISLAETMYRNATTDSLTGLLNRTSFFAQAEQEAALFQRSGRTFGLLMLDLDFFKKVNDSFGHPAGDQLLAQFALRLRQQLRLEDLLARIGGEEFAILLRASDEVGCQDVAERLRLHVSSSPFRLQTPNGTVDHHATVSIGIAFTRPGDRLGNLVDRADQALYNAKNQGRNRACGS